MNSLDQSSIKNLKETQESIDEKKKNQFPDSEAEDVDLYGEIKLKFVTWRQMSHMLNKNLVYELEQYYKYSDQSSASESEYEL